MNFILYLREHFVTVQEYCLTDLKVLYLSLNMPLCVQSLLILQQVVKANSLIHLHIVFSSV